MRKLENVFSVVVCVWAVAFSMTAGQCPDYSTDGCISWSDAATWPSNKVPADNDAVTVSSCIVLDTDTARLGPVTIATGGSLVFSPEVTSDVTLTAASVLVQGTLRIGSQKCRYEGKANIVLTGKPGENENSDFGSKFIGVTDGGTLELHGHKKLSWSKVNVTLEKLTPDNGMYFNSEDADNLLTWKDGFLVYVADPSNGGVRYKNILYTGGTNQRRFDQDSEELINIMNAVPANFLIILLANKNAIHTMHNMTSVYEAVEKAIYCKVGHSRLRHLERGQAYAMIALKEHPKRTVEVIGRHQDEDGFRTAVAWFSMPQTNMAIHAISKLHSQSWRQTVKVVGATYDAAVPVVAMANDVSTWVPGDRVVIASTDYAWEQAEEGIVEKCSVHHRNITCHPNEVRINFPRAFMHWGDVTHKVDMRAEVGLISRNIRIRGEIANDAEGEEARFGGQIKIKENFQDVHIEGVELNYMGQHFSTDAFPIFFDMAQNVSDVTYTNPAYVTDNSIVNSFRGCVALRATHGLVVSKNVAYKHMTSCFMLMDGGEKHNTFDGNLAIGTVEPENNNPALRKFETQRSASFFITNPLTTFINNVAAGGEDMGIVYAFPEEPLGTSRALGLMQRNEAFHTPLVEFSGNVAHSYADSGVDLTKSITDGEEFYYNSKYEPKADPLQPADSEDVQVFVNQLTSYKNRWSNLNSRGGFFNFHQCSFSDSANGIGLYWSSSQRQYITDSVVLGESPNIGEPETFWDGDLKVWESLPRSVPIYWNREHPIRGITLVDGPHYFHNIWISGFVNTPNYTVGAISFLDGNRWSTSPQTSFEGISWGFDDGDQTGNRVWDDPVGLPDATPEKTGEKQAVFRDLDGSVTGMLDSTVVKPYPMLYTDDCSLRENWNLYVCPHRYAKISVKTYSSAEKTSISPFMTRDDLPGQSFYQNWRSDASFPVVIGEDYSYILAFDSDMPEKIILDGIGIEKDLWVRMGVCLPKDAEIELYTWNPDWRPRIDQWNQLDNITSLEETDVATSYFWDQDNGFVFFKLKNEFSRDDTFPYEWDECPEDKCPMVRLTITNADDIDMDVSDCTARAYEGDAPYKRTRSSVSNARSDQVSSVSSLPATSSEPSEEIGAGDSYPFQGMDVIQEEGYGQWTEWSDCTAICGGGTQERDRSCGEDSGCAGPSFETVRCNTFQCTAEHSNTTAWSDWSECSATCGGGTETRTRDCKPDKVCSDPLEQTRDCNTEACPVDGSWSSWVSWSECTATCGGGIRTRSRTCDDPAPSVDGVQCQGDVQDTGNCNQEECVETCQTVPPSK